MRNFPDFYRGNRMPSMFGVMQDFDELFRRMLSNPYSLVDEVRPAGLDEEWFEPRVDVQDSDQAFLLTIDVPGLKREDIKIDLNDNLLTISGERKRETNEEGGRSFERMYGRFVRSFTLPTTVEADKVEASLEDGVLRLALPKSEATKPRSIEVKSGRPGFFSKLIGSGERKESKKDKKIDVKTSDSVSEGAARTTPH